MDVQKEKAKKALKAAQSIGIPCEEMKPVLKQLLSLFGGHWETIEQDNYRVLLDAYFDRKENKGAEDVTNGTMERGSVERPSKKLHMEEDRVSLKMESTSRKPDDKMLSEKARHKLVMSSRSSLQYPKVGSSSQLSRLNDEGKNIISISGGEGRRDLAIKSDVLDQQSLDAQKQQIRYYQKKPFQFFHDITKGTEKVKISLVDEIGNEKLPHFNYIPHNLPYEDAHVRISFARIDENECCSSCFGDCLSPSKYPCACAGETAGEFAYTSEGLLKHEFIKACQQKKHVVYCTDCPLEKSKNEHNPEPCKGHLIKKFIRECWTKCGCHMQCGNRVVQRGITRNLQVFCTKEGKGWGLRTLERLPMGSFVCEYVGEILTNTELYKRNLQSGANERHTYPIMLDADWCSEKILEDDDALCLDATFQGNVARFINHRCYDANLIDVPVKIETPDRHYYHIAFFTNRKVDAFEELTWDYAIDFDDDKHPIKAFRCCCGSPYCRYKKRNGSTSGREIEIIELD